MKLTGCLLPLGVERPLRDPVTWVLVLTVVSAVSGQSCRAPFNDLPSKAVKSKVIFVGEPVEPKDRQEQMDPHLLITEFKVNGLEKSHSSFVLPDNQRVLVGWESKGDEGEKGCGNFNPKKKYFVFLDGSSVMKRRENETGVRIVHVAYGTPEEDTKIAKRKINQFTCDKCTGEGPRVKPLPRRIAAIGRLELKCRTSGVPLPLITWHKGTEAITVTSNRVKIMKNGSRLLIRPAMPSDSGLYFCQASNVLGTVNSSKVNVTINSENRSTVGIPVVLCAEQSHCLNQGTCLTLPTIGKHCLCPKRFTGTRCQNKEPGNSKGPERWKPVDSKLRPLIIVGLILIALIAIILAVIAYCLARTRYDNAKRMNGWTVAGDSDVRANGVLLRSLNGISSEKFQKFSSSSEAANGDSEDARVVGLPQVLVTLIEEEDRTRTTSAKNERPPPQSSTGNAKRPDIRVICPDLSSTFAPSLTRPRLAAVSTTPCSATSSINLHLETPVSNADDHTGSC